MVIRAFGPGTPVASPSPVSGTLIPATVTGVPTGTIPKLPLVERNRQTAVAKLAIFAYDRASGQLVWQSGTMLDKADTKDVYVGGFGPIKSGTIQDGTDPAVLPLRGSVLQQAPGALPGSD